MVKINVDASLSYVVLVGLWVVGRDSNGVVLFFATRRVKAYWIPEVVEAKAIELALWLGKRFGLSEVILEYECQVVIKRLSKSVTFLLDLDKVLHDILACFISFTFLVWFHVKRDGNCVAHHLAKLVPFGVRTNMGKPLPSGGAPYACTHGQVVFKLI